MNRGLHASNFMGAAVPRQEEPMSKESWELDYIQFPRLISEINAVGLTDEQNDLLRESMDVCQDFIDELFDRADETWERIKTKKAQKFPPPVIDDEGYLRGVVAVSIDELLNRDLDGFLDLLSLRMTNTELLGELRYDIVGFNAPDTIYLRVSGDPALVCSNNPKFQKMWEEMEKRCDNKGKGPHPHRRKRSTS